MITIELWSGETAIMNEGVWSVPDNREIERVLNLPEMQPPLLGYAPTEDARKAEWVLKEWGGKWVSTTDHWPKELIY